jgi:non-ribosomal peptide synthetase component F
LFSRDGNQFFNAGEIDDLRIYSQALTAAEIQQLFQAGSASLVPANPSIATQQFAATGADSNGSTPNLTGAVTWSSTSTATIIRTGLSTDKLEAAQAREGDDWPHLVIGLPNP